MTLRPEFTLPHPELNDFLFAIVGEEKNGSDLTVLSALSRLGLDPWGEAARLCELSDDMATSALASKIVALPEGYWSASESRSIAARLVMLLPSPGSGPSGREQVSDGDRLRQRPELSPRLVWVAMGVAIVAYLLFQYAW